MRRGLAVLLCVLGVAGCSAAPAPSTAPTQPPPASPSAQPGGGEQFEQALRDRLRPPALPSFTLPGDVLSVDAHEQMARRLQLSPGLYQGIAVLDARCTPDGPPVAADTGTPGNHTGGAGHVDDGTRSITVAGDGTGVYDAPGLHVAVLPGGAGVYDDGRVRLTVQSDRSGTLEDPDRRLTVRADGSGSYRDRTSRLWVGPDGAGGYDDDRIQVSLRADGTVDGKGDPDLVAAAVEVLREGLPRFAPVPAIVRPRPRGTACGTVIRLDADVLFDFDAADLRPDGARLVDRVAALLRELGSPRVQVVGHTDHVGPHEYNRQLSERRAGAVAHALAGAGVAEPSLRTAGLGETQPVRPGVTAEGRDDEAARQLNRRVELVLLD